MGTDGDVRQSPGELLEQAIKDAGYSIRGYARFRAERTWGSDPTRNQIDDKRRQLNKWISGETKTITDPVAEELAADLGKPAGYFKTSKAPRRRRREEIAALREELEDVRGALEHLGDRVAQLEGVRERSHAPGDRRQGS